MKNGNDIIPKKRKKSPRITRSFGPVDNLETHLQPDWWRRIFNSMYLKTDSDVVDDKQITSLEVTMFTEILDINPESIILDLACGQGRHSNELARRGFKNVHGLDRSHFLIRKAKATAASEGINTSFREGDARKLPYPTDYFDVVMILGNSFGYFESTDDDIKILHEIFRILKPNGKFLLDLADGEYLKSHYNPRSWEWLDNKHFVCRERSLASDDERLISREVITNIEKGVIVDQFYAERLYTPYSLETVLSKIGFKEIKTHGSFSPDSKRNQDLGMMEQRIIATCKVLKDWTPVKKKITLQKNVVVIMGDPGKPDVIKPSSTFDEDDFNTISQLKKALTTLPNYKFIFLNNHNTLINDLQRLKPKIDFVLNLCDEGFNNDARKELHVPALLEMLEIPYSGSNPQCLAYCYDKSLIRGIAKEIGVPVAEAFYIKPEDNVFEMNIDFPVIVKPNFGDSSFGITQKSVAYTIEDLNDAIIRIREQFGYEKPILVEEFLSGNELTVGIIGNPPESYTILPLVEEDYSHLPPELPKICGYEAKWLEDSPYFKLLKSIPSQIAAETEKQIVEHCLRMAERLETRDYTRFDWRLDTSGNPYLLEVNPNPGWCWDGHLAKMSRFGGLDYAQMLEQILIATNQRITNSYSNGNKRDEVINPMLELNFNS